MPAWLVKTRRAPSRHSRDARVFGHTTTVMHEISTPPPPLAPPCPRPRPRPRPPSTVFLLFPSSSLFHEIGSKVFTKYGLNSCHTRSRNNKTTPNYVCRVQLKLQIAPLPVLGGVSRSAVGFAVVGLNDNVTVELLNRGITG